MTTVRPAGPADVEAVADLETRVFADSAAEAAWSRRSVEDEFAALGATRRIVVAADGRRVVGHAVLLVAGDTGDLIRVAVDHACRRQGTGSRLVGAILVEARSIGLDTVFLEVAAGNSAAIALYERHRFAPIDRRAAYCPDGSDALVMRCELQQRSASFEEGASHVR